MPKRITVAFSAYCGMLSFVRFEDRADARHTAARRILRARHQGYHVETLTKGERWEVQEPETSVLVPDECGTLSLTAERFECQECGTMHDDSDDAGYCCFYDETQDDASADFLGSYGIGEEG